MGFVPNHVGTLEWVSSHEGTAQSGVPGISVCVCVHTHVSQCTWVCTHVLCVFLHCDLSAAHFSFLYNDIPHITKRSKKHYFTSM